MTEASDVLVIARWRHPGDYTAAAGSVYAADEARTAELLCANRHWLAEVESLIVARGLGEQYGRALAVIVFGSSSNRAGDVWPTFPADFEDLAMIRTAPLSAITRALASVIRASDAP